MSRPCAAHFRKRRLGVPRRHLEGLRIEAPGLQCLRSERAWLGLWCARASAIVVSPMRRA